MHLLLSSAPHLSPQVVLAFTAALLAGYLHHHRKLADLTCALLPSLLCLAGLYLIVMHALHNIQTMPTAIIGDLWHSFASWWFPQRTFATAQPTHSFQPLSWSTQQSLPDPEWYAREESRAQHERMKEAAGYWF